MTPEENQAELDKYRDIIFATIDYSFEKETLRQKPEQLEYTRNFHRLWREQAEAQYKGKELEKLKKSMDTLTLTYKITGDIFFVNYIKEKTGYDFDLFGNIYERIDKILAQNKITNRKERLDAATMTELYRKTSIGQEKAHMLHNLCFDFDASQQKKKSGDTDFPPLKYLLEMNSPDNKRYVTMYEISYADYPSTYMNIHFEDGVMSSVYAAEGNGLGINVYWKDNHTIVMKMKKGVKAFMKHSLKQRLQDTIQIEYIEL